MEFNQPHSSSIRLCRPFFYFYLNFRFVFIVHPNETSVLLFCRSEEGRTKCLCVKSYFLFIYFYFYFLKIDKLKKQEECDSAALTAAVPAAHFYS